MKVFGIGQKKTPNPFIAACDKFIYLEVIAIPDVVESIATPDKAAPKPAPKTAVDKLNKKTLQLIVSTINDLGDENGWAFLGDVGNLLLKKQPDFDPRNYGFQKLTPLFKSLPQFEIDKRETEKGGTKLIYIRNSFFYYSSGCRNPACIPTHGFQYHYGIIIIGINIHP